MRAARGFTLVEVMLTCAVVGIIAGMALPSYRQPMLRAHRSDAVAALTRVQAAQERWRGDKGGYAGELAALHLPALSDDGLYRLSVEVLGPDTYRATAQATGPQAADSECAALTLEVRIGFAQPGPSTACWNR